MTVGGTVRRILRIWAAILVAYAVLLQGLAPAAALAGPAGTALVLCSQVDRVGAGHRQPAHDDRPGLSCCLFCPAGAAPLLPGPPAQPAVRLLQTGAAPRPAPVGAVLPATGGRSPQVPRAPPLSA